MGFLMGQGYCLKGMCAFADSSFSNVVQGALRFRKLRQKKATEGPALDTNGAQTWDLAQITTNNLGPEHFGSKCGTQIFRKICFVIDLASHGSKWREN